MLTKSSPTNLFKFIFHCYELPALGTFKLFFDNWKEKHSNMDLKLIYNIVGFNNTLVERYISEGILVEPLGDNERTEDFE
ncbi:hypothetical protein GLOIN_2v1789914 [Rhizophagus clarus]|uniref:Uncharacterized protein n=1 Tax=Rhizophagus clarus TaxID=94130 RepID=A0A8H3KUY2_9GLOM|nr:hypothetical protein GLOIN_2v1789914 [Rhizophagus clarus]